MRSVLAAAVLALAGVLATVSVTAWTMGAVSAHGRTRASVPRSAHTTLTPSISVVPLPPVDRLSPLEHRAAPSKNGAALSA